MQLLQGNSQVTKLHDGTQSYKLVAEFIRYGHKVFNLSANANYVMIVLLNFYNPTKGFVFPKHETISEQTGLSVSTIKRSIKELINAHLLMKTRKKNCNLYGFTSTLFDLLHGSERTNKMVQSELSHDKHDKENKIKQHAVVDFKISKEEVTKRVDKETEADSTVVSVSFETNGKDDIPAIIRENPNVKNPVAYWKSLRPAVKEEYKERQALLEEEQRKKEELKKRIEEERQAKIEEKRKLDEDLARPLEEQYSKATSIKLIWQLRKMPRVLNKEDGLFVKLAKIYDIKIEEVFKLTKEELEETLKHFD